LGVFEAVVLAIVLVLTLPPSYSPKVPREIPVYIARGLNPLPMELSVHCCRTGGPMATTSSSGCLSGHLATGMRAKCGRPPRAWQLPSRSGRRRCRSGTPPLPHRHAWHPWVPAPATTTIPSSRRQSRLLLRKRSHSCSVQTTHRAWDTCCIASGVRNKDEGRKATCRGEHVALTCCCPLPTMPGVPGYRVLH
jgi:hypothetical protein